MTRALGVGFRLDGELMVVIPVDSEYSHTFIFVESSQDLQSVLARGQ